MTAPGPPRGILHPDAHADGGGHERLAPSDGLRGLVEHYWFVWWDLRGQPPRVAETLPHPSVHVVARDGAVRVLGVVRGRFTTTLSDMGRVVGIKFRPGAFAPFLGRAVTTLSDRSLPLVDVFGADAAALEAIMLDDAPRPRLAARIDAFLTAHRPPPDAQVDVVADVVAAIMADRAITKVEHVAERTGLGVRTLQRLFRHYVGVTPKWVIQRYRLHEAAERLRAGDGAPLATLALELGYADQAHFINDFRRVVGATPASYMKRVTRDP
ncbi:MAG: AraC family transcriptional regulator [Gemmatirosa sp.]|nr:AraC family transcriptional regulator [Gemmatirosa sp.]